MAHRSSALRRRIERLIDSSEQPVDHQPRWLIAATSLGLVALLTLAAPGITSDISVDAFDDALPPGARADESADPLAAELTALDWELEALTASVRRFRRQHEDERFGARVSELLQRIEQRRLTLDEHYQRLVERRDEHLAKRPVADAPATYDEPMHQTAKE
jgi:hypothetical protein